MGVTKPKKIKAVVAMYFSATDTTKRVVETLAETLGKELGIVPDVMDFTLPRARKKIYEFGDETLVILGVPVIAGRVPNLLLPFFENVKGHGSWGLPVVLFGNRHFDDALMELKLIMESHDFYPLAGAALVGEHSFSSSLAMGRPDREDQKELRAFAFKVLEKYENMLKKNGPSIKPLQVEGNNPPGPYYLPRDSKGNHIDIRKVKPKTDEDLCNRCGLCANLCPLGSIDHEDVTQVGLCMKCCACIKKCPKGAKYFDDSGYIYHKEELELQYGDLRKDNRFFL